MKTPKKKIEEDYRREDNKTSNHLFWRKSLKDKILSASMLCDRYKKEYEQLYYVLERTIKFSESDSVLLVGFKGSGKTTVSLNN